MMSSNNPSKHSPCVGIRTCSDYSPFGVELDGRTVSGGYRFGYQGSEKDNEFKGNGNSYTTEFRQLNPRLGRWLSVDPKSEEEVSNYANMDNNPMLYNDIFGLYTKRRAEKMAQRGSQNGYVTNVKLLEGSKNNYGVAYSKRNESNTGSYMKNQFQGRFRGTENMSLVMDSEITQERIDETSEDFTENALKYSMLGINFGMGSVSTFTIHSGKYLLNNEFWRYQPSGKKKIITPLSKTSNGQSYWNNNFAKKARLKQINQVQNVRNMSSKLTKLGGALVITDVALSGELKPSHVINSVMLGASTTGVGAIVSGVWFVADFGTMGVNYLLGNGAKGIGDMIDESTGKIEMYEGAY